MLDARSHIHHQNEKPRVLIVEDEILVALQIEDLLEEEGFEVVGSIADHAALERIECAPHVALVDLNLRDGFTGPDIANDLARRFGARIVFVTANPERIGNVAPKPEAIVPKPFSRAAILEAVTGALAAQSDGDGNAH